MSMLINTPAGLLPVEAGWQFMDWEVVVRCGSSKQYQGGWSEENVTLDTVCAAVSGALAKGLKPDSILVSAAMVRRVAMDAGALGTEAALGMVAIAAQGFRKHRLTNDFRNHPTMNVVECKKCGTRISYQAIACARDIGKDLMMEHGCVPLKLHHRWSCEECGEESMLVYSATDPQMEADYQEHKYLKHPQPPVILCRAGAHVDGLFYSCEMPHGHKDACDWEARKLSTENLQAECKRRGLSSILGSENGKTIADAYSKLDREERAKFRLTAHLALTDENGRLSLAGYSNRELELECSRRLVLVPGLSGDSVIVQSDAEVKDIGEALHICNKVGPNVTIGKKMVGALLTTVELQAACATRGLTTCGRSDLVVLASVAKHCPVGADVYKWLETAATMSTDRIPGYPQPMVGEAIAKLIERAAADDSEGACDIIDGQVFQERLADILAVRGGRKLAADIRGCIWALVVKVVEAVNAPPVMVVKLPVKTLEVAMWGGIGDHGPNRVASMPPMKPTPKRDDTLDLATLADLVAADE